MEKKLQQQLIIAGAAAGLIYFGILDPLLKFLGIKTSADSAALDSAASNPNSFWSPQFWKNQRNAIIMTRSSAESIAKNVYDAFGAFNDNEEQAIGALKALHYQTQVSFLSDVFFQLYSMDLITFLRGGSWPQDRLSDSDVQDLNLYLSKLPVS